MESLRPYLGADDLHRDLELVDELAAAPAHGLQLLADLAPGVFRAGWALIVGPEGTAAASAGSPELTGVALPWLPLTAARRMGADEQWVPERWNTIGTELAAAPVGAPDRAILVGRPGGRAFASEILRLAHLAGIAATVTARAPPPSGS